MTGLRFKRKERAIGKVYGKRLYDLPLSKSAGSGFLLLLIGLMTFLAMLALASSFALSAMTQRWSSGLENRVTIEIPATDAQGTLLSKEDHERDVRRINSMLESHPAVAHIHILSDAEIQDLVKPWLGDNLLTENIPLPGLIAVELKQSDDKTTNILKEKIQNLVPLASLDTHESWLNDLLRFTGALRFAAALLTFVIGITTVIAIAGAVRSRMAEHSADVELLHIMGASDNYIAGQFQRHSMFLGIQGAVLGVIIGAIAMMIIGWLAGEMNVNLLPEFKLDGGQIIALASLPIMAALIAVAAARFTVLKVLSEFP